MIVSSNLGFPRIGPDRGLKKALESYWSGKTGQQALQETGRSIRRQSWQWQQEAGIQHVPSNDFSLYDHVLDTSVIVGAIPPRFDGDGGPASLATYFAMARGDAKTNVPPLEMTKWFDTNYHYLVPELQPGQKFRLCSTKPVDEFQEAKSLGIHTRPVLLGPVTYLLLGKSRGEGFHNLSLLKALLPVYEELLDKLARAGADWVQMDEPCLATDLDDTAQAALQRAYGRLGSVSPQLALLIASYFGPLRDNLAAAVSLPVQALHVDLVRGQSQLDEVLARLPEHVRLSAGLVDGRNIWKTDLAQAAGLLRRVVNAIGEDRTMVGPSCSLLHVPVDLGRETALDAAVHSWLAFGRQKLAEIVTLAEAVAANGRALQSVLAENAAAIQDRRQSPLTHSAEVRRRAAAITPEMSRRKSPYSQRRAVQRKALPLPLFPTTTIGSFPQTAEVRARQGKIPARGTLSRAIRRLPAKDAGRDHPLSRRGRTGCFGPRRGRAERYGRVFRRATQRFCIYKGRLGAKLRLAVREAAGHLRRCLTPGANDRPLGARGDGLYEKTRQRHVDRSGDGPLLVVCPRRSTAQRDVPANRPGGPRRGA